MSTLDLLHMFRIPKFKLTFPSIQTIFNQPQPQLIDTQHLILIHHSHTINMSGYALLTLSHLILPQGVLY